LYSAQYTTRKEKVKKDSILHLNGYYMHRGFPCSNKKLDSVVPDAC
jgi:hypothetical protein